ncbi:MAG TPA: xanthine dehydrogenase family protein molybdopterin-binding subunit [Gaiellaceae bacterium]|nr:xanthine dehydrogenase family protein molybdopterin-binding subunit [Gaiellaceae bacterium]
MSATAAPPRAFGAPLKRKEDPRLLRGEGRYVADLKVHRMAHAAVLRSPHAHALVRAIRLDALRADPRTLDVVVGADVADLPHILCIDAEETTRLFTQPLLAVDKVRYVGEPLAVVVVEGDRYDAEDVLGLIDVEYEPLPAVVDAEAALANGAPILHEETNVCDVLEYATGDIGAIDRAPHRLRRRFVTQRHAGTPLETRGCLADYDARRDQITLWTSTQTPHGVKRGLAYHLGLPESALRVVAPDVGGGFGTKLQIYQEEVLICLLARRLRRPVKWVEDRWEHFVATTHGREQTHDIEVGYDEDGVVVGVRDHAVTDTGAYLARLTLVEPFIGVAMLRGPYRIPNFEARSAIVMTNKTPMNPFRGVGHIQAAQAMDGMLDDIARERGLDPAEVRRRNMLKPEELPLDIGVGNVLAGPVIYDSGNYPEALRRALELVGYDQFRAEQARMRERGRYLGIGIGCYVEETALGPYESGTVRVEPSGQVVVLTGACTSGQGHHTVLAQIAADELGVSPDDVVVVHGDTDLVREGVGTYASRSAPIAGTAVRNAGMAARRKILAVAEHLLEANAGDLVLEGGRVFVAGSPERGLALAEVAQAVAPGCDLPPGIDSYGIDETDIFHPPTNAFPYGVHVATVEVDIETGVVTPMKLAVVSDAGRLINPLIVEGQYQGGVALGIGGALLEEILYTEDGQPANPNFMDYLLPAVDNMPEILLDHLHTPTPHNPDGMKGCGEGGAIGPPAAIANAVSDALSPFGIVVTRTPVTPLRVYELLVEAGVVAPP